MEGNKQIREIIKQVGWIRLLLLFLCGIFLILVSLPEQKEQEAEAVTKSIAFVDSDENDIYVEKMEERLGEILEMMEGAGRVEVMITLASSAETVVNKDSSYEENSETDKSGEGKESVSSIRKEETVFSEIDGNENPYILKTMEPAVEGIIIVMDGGGDPFVSSAVSEAVQALFQVEAHKIKVLKMEDGS